MIGIGTWQCRVDTMFFKGDVKFKITDNNGKYGLEIIMDGPVPKFEIKNIREKSPVTDTGSSSRRLRRYRPRSWG